MFQTDFQLLQQNFGQSNRRAQAARAAARLYQQARLRGRMGRARSVLVRHSRRLLELSAIEATHTVCARHDVGVQAVPLHQIQGSEGRCHDFDRDFAPLQKHNRVRWLNVAIARQMDVTLPPVELIQVSDVYFVRDGHHRISVARALGQQEIDAVVTVWRTDGSSLSSRQMTAPFTLRRGLRPWLRSKAQSNAQAGGL